jgi:Outer membrane lipoprotein-sorting protein
MPPAGCPGSADAPGGNGRIRQQFIDKPRVLVSILSLMNKNIRIEIRMKYALPALPALSSLSAGAAEIPQVIQSCMQRNLPETTSAQSIELRARDRSGYEQVLEADVYWKRYAEDQARVLMYFREPVDIRGARFLVVEKQPQNDMYIYMPSLFKVRKVTSRNLSNSIMGTDFSYEDFERIQGMLSDLRAEQFPDDTLAGRAVYVLMSYPPETSGYVKVATYIDKESCIPLKTELYESGHELRKQLTVDPSAIQHEAGIYYPRELVVKDLKQKTETRLIVHDVTLGAQLGDDLFDAGKMQQAEIPAITSKP